MRVASVCLPDTGDVFDAVVLPGRDELVLRLRRELDVATEATARGELERRLHGVTRPVLVDLAGVFVGVSGIRVLLHAERITARAGVPCAVVAPPAWLSRLAPALGLEGRIAFRPVAVPVDEAGPPLLVGQR